MKQIGLYLAAVLTLLLNSCSDNDYLNAIPEGSMALISVDMQKMAQSRDADINMLKDMLHTDNVDDCGIDMTSKVYLFESADGNLGLCAKVADKGDVEKWIESLVSQGLAKQPTERKGNVFTVMKDSWVVGVSDHAMLIMGPAVGAAQAQLQQQITKQLEADEEQGIKDTPMFARLDSISSPVAMVAQAQALPEKFVAPFTLGAPKDADASQILIAAEMNVKGSCLTISGETFSFNKEIDKALHEAARTYRPVTARYIRCMPADALMGVFMNVDGQKLISLLRTNKGLQAMLTGINAAIDMDNIIRSIDGDMSIVVPTVSDDNLRISMAAQLSHKKWLDDVSYWKQSCPKGSSIGDWGKDSYFYTDGSTSFYFGVSADNQFFSGNSRDAALGSIAPATKPIGKDIQELLEGKRMCMVLNLNALGTDNSEVSAATSMLKPLFGNINSIVYSIK